jgi:hypothetical protein
MKLNYQSALKKMELMKEENLSLKLDLEHRIK